MGWLPKQIIVVPVDFSQDSFDAVLLAKQMVKEPRGLHVLNVQVPAAISEVSCGWGDLTDEDRVASALKELNKQLADHSINDVTPVVHIGSPGLEIAAYAREVGADLIVIPSHGRTGLKHIFMGSVAERVARHATCPVLIFRREDQVQKNETN